MEVAVAVAAVVVGTATEVPLAFAAAAAAAFAERPDRTLSNRPSCKVNWFRCYQKMAYWGYNRSSRIHGEETDPHPKRTESVHIEALLAVVVVVEVAVEGVVLVVDFHVKTATRCTVKIV